MSEVTQALDSAGDDLEDGEGPPELPVMVVASDEHAAEVARQALREGGSAFEAAVKAAGVFGGDWCALVWEAMRAEPVVCRGGGTSPPLEGSYRGHPVWLPPGGEVAPAALEALRQLDELPMRDLDAAERDRETREAVRAASPDAAEVDAAGGAGAGDAACVVVVDGRGQACSLVSRATGTSGSEEAVPGPIMVSRADRPWLLLAFAGRLKDLCARVHTVAQVAVQAIDLARPPNELAAIIEGLRGIAIDPDTGTPTPIT